jgi:transposase
VKRPFLNLPSNSTYTRTRLPSGKTQLLEGAEGVFGEAKEQESAKVDVTRLHAKIGELSLERDFLESALSKAGLLSAKR